MIFAVAIVNGSGKTTVSVKREDFYINGEITYKDASNSNMPGLLLNSRMINSIFDNSATEYNYLFEYPDTGVWDPTRNTNEFVGNLSLYKSYGLLSFTVGLQGGNPFGFSKYEPDNINGQPWVVSAYDVDSGELNTPYFDRLKSILDEADRLGMVTIVSMFYKSQVDNMKNNDAIMNAINNTLDWLMDTKNGGVGDYNNIMIEVANECNVIDNSILGIDGMPNTIDYIRDYTKGKYLIGSSTTGGYIPPDVLIETSDIVYLHGDSRNTQELKSDIETVQSNSAFKNNPKPIYINEDDYYNFDSDRCHFDAAIDNHVSWGVFVKCNGTTAGDYIYGYQCVPVNWKINTPLKKQFFEKVKGYSK